MWEGCSSGPPSVLVVSRLGRSSIPGGARFAVSLNLAVLPGVRECLVHNGGRDKRWHRLMSSCLSAFAATLAASAKAGSGDFALVASCLIEADIATVEDLAILGALRSESRSFAHNVPNRSTWTSWLLSPVVPACTSAPFATFSWYCTTGGKHGNQGKGHGSNGLLTESIDTNRLGHSCPCNNHSSSS